MNDARPLALCILAALRGSPKPLKRRELADRCGPHGCKVSTAERRIREALEWLVWHHYPVLNEGGGFFIARNAEQFDKGLQKRERAVRSELLKLQRLRADGHRMQYPEQSSAQPLPFEAAS